MAEKRKKYQLPVVAELTHIQIDLSLLKEALAKVNDKFVNVRQANPGLCDNHKVLAEEVYSHFDQVNLTTMRGEPLPYTDDIKERIRRREENLYRHPTPDFKNSYFEYIVNQFKEPAMRVRITRLKPDTNIPHHIDYDPSYASRVIIPIITHEKVINEFRVKNEVQRYYLEAGKAYFLNTGFSHAVFNESPIERVAFMFSLDGQSDLENI